MSRLFSRSCHVYLVAALAALTSVVALTGCEIGVDGRPDDATCIDADCATDDGDLPLSLLDGDYLVGSRAGLLALPTSGAAWNTVLSNARLALVPNLADQDNLSPANAVAAGLVYARTGMAAYRDKVVTALRKLPGTEVTARTLSIGRQMAGWIMAADLVGYTLHGSLVRDCPVEGLPADPGLSVAPNGVGGYDGA